MRRILLALLLAAGHAHAAVCPGYTVCPIVRYPHVMSADPAAIALLANIDATETASVRGLGANGLTFGQLVALLGEALVYDKSLSASGNEACAVCHDAGAGFAGGLPIFARGGGIFPGTDTRRTGYRVPQSLAYAGFAPVLSYNASTRVFTGGNFWDERATGLVTGSAAADQPEVPLTSPFEMALPDPACAVRRVALAAYGSVFGQVWGTESLNIKWPGNTDRVCARLNDGGADQTPLALSLADRARATNTVAQIGATIATFETSPLASPFTAKFDAVQAGTATFTPAEQLGYTLFTGSAHCGECHAATGTHALLTNFTNANIGVPQNADVPYLTENAPDRFGYVANPGGTGFIDAGFGGFLASAADTNAQWQALAPQFIGTFQVPTLRNAAAGRKRSYTHNGYFTDLKLLVHFFNTRDVLPRCTGSTGVGVTCWPAPEVPQNVNATQMGNLGLSAAQENALVAFLRSLTDGYAQ
jgi:cytochrome c peroxidase